MEKLRKAEKKRLKKNVKVDKTEENVEKTKEEPTNNKEKLGKLNTKLKTDDKIKRN